MNSIENTVSIRRMKPGDIEDIERIYSLITKRTLKGDFRDLVVDQASPQGTELVCFVAEMEERVVGFMISHVITFSFGMEKSAWIATMGVDPKYMGRNIGARLANEIFQFYKSQGISSIYTSVRWDATDVVSFFKTLGFNRSDFINLRKSID